MANPFLLAGLGAVGDLAGTFFNNKLGKDTSREMFDLENAYNAPKAQMERLKLAGLNPNLVYGNGSVANTGKISTPDVKQSSLGGDSVKNYTGTISNNLQNDLLQKQTEYYDAMIRDKDSQVKTRDTATLPKIMADLENTNLSNEQKRQYIATYLDSWSVGMQEKKQAIENMATSNQYTQTQIKMYPKHVQQQINESIARIKSMNVNNQATQIRTQLDLLKKDLRKNGIETTDNLLMRLLNPAVSWSKKQWGEILNKSKWKF